MTRRAMVPECAMMPADDDLFILLDGRKIAKRGRPGTPQAMTWVSLEPGYAVYDDGDEEIVVTYRGHRIQ